MVGILDIMRQQDPKERARMGYDMTLQDLGTPGHPLSMTPMGILYRAATEGPGVLQGMWDTFKTPGDVAMGRKPATVEDAARFALDVGLTSAPVPAPKGALRTFGGPKAKTADHAMLKLAKEMADNGVGRDDIWNKTGWFKGVDGKWRFEIDDSTAFLDAPKNAPPGYRRLEHFDAEAAYPDRWGKMQQSIRTDPNATEYGSYSEPKNVLSVHAPDEKMLPISLHETQHMMQGREGFAKGGSPRQFSDPDAARKINDFWSKYIAPKIDESNMTPKDKLNILFDREIAMDFLESPKQKMEYARLLREARMVTDFDAYKRLAGETEARLVESRMNLTPEQRRAIPPWSKGPYGYDVPEADQIVRFNTGGASAEKASILRYLLGK